VQCRLKKDGLGREQRSFRSHEPRAPRAYLDDGEKEDIILNVDKIQASKAPDVAMKDGDVLFIPTSNVKLVMLQGIQSALNISSSVVSIEPQPNPNKNPVTASSARSFWAAEVLWMPPRAKSSRPSIPPMSQAFPAVLDGDTKLPLGTLDIGRDWGWAPDYVQVTSMMLESELETLREEHSV